MLLQLDSISIVEDAVNSILKKLNILLANKQAILTTKYPDITLWTLREVAYKDTTNM